MAYIGLLPSRLCQLADELSLPLFEQPYSLPMVDVTEAIGRAIVSAERQDGAARTLADAIVADLGRERLRVLVERYLGEDPAGTDGELLDAWLCHRGNQSLMAEALGCHRNTIRNRLHRLAGPAPAAAMGMNTSRHGCWPICCWMRRAWRAAYRRTYERSSGCHCERPAAGQGRAVSAGHRRRPVCRDHPQPGTGSRRRPDAGRRRQSGGATVRGAPYSSGWPR